VFALVKLSGSRRTHFWILLFGNDYSGQIVLPSPIQTYATTLPLIVNEL
jgi:hypothetical protein